MNYGELRTLFSDLLNRNDCSDTLADTFISMGLRRVERLLRTPIQTSTFTKTIDNTWTGFEPIPTDYLGVKTISVNNIPVPRITWSQAQDGGGWIIKGGGFFFYPDLKEGDTLRVDYYNEFLRGVADDAITDYSSVLTDVTVYAALTYAGDYFIDERLDRWQATLSGLIQEVQLMADIDETSGGLQITPIGGGIV
ncbi:MAG: hypothetical protein IE937_01140 [Gammaproteobacteria bacterium]|nr:hypothetical protein [Gammaproteobacteria bacterium]